MLPKSSPFFTIKSKTPVRLSYRRFLLSSATIAVLVVVLVVILIIILVVVLVLLRIGLVLVFVLVAHFSHLSFADIIS